MTILQNNSKPPREPDLIVPGDGQSLSQLLGPIEALPRGGVWVDGIRTLDPDYIPEAGAVIYIHVPPAGTYASLELGLDSILYEDDWLIALNKPAGSYVEATPWDYFTHVRGTLRHLLKMRDELEYPLHLAHRLDRDTSGVLLLTKHPDANAGLQRSFIKHIVQKRYLAMCNGTPRFDEMVIETGHGRSRGGRFRIYPLEELGQLLPNGQRVKAMRTRLQIVERVQSAAVLWAWPETGRSHQIRLHLAHLGHALLGDAIYGGPLEWQGQQLTGHRLHAESMRLPHPITGSKLVLTAPMPEWASRLEIAI